VKRWFYAEFEDTRQATDFVNRHLLLPGEWVVMTSGGLGYWERQGRRFLLQIAYYAKDELQ
jgi:hypothetical protein